MMTVFLRGGDPPYPPNARVSGRDRKKARSYHAQLHGRTAPLGHQVNTGVHSGWANNTAKCPANGTAGEMLRVEPWGNGGICT